MDSPFYWIGFSLGLMLGAVIDDLASGFIIGVFLGLTFSLIDNQYK
jgi:hypothetical protein